MRSPTPARDTSARDDLTPRLCALFAPLFESWIVGPDASEREPEAARRPATTARTRPILRAVS